MYQALYRKYRSQTFGQLVGQEVVATTFGRQLNRIKSVMPISFQVPEGQERPA